MIRLCTASIKSSNTVTITKQYSTISSYIQKQLNTKNLHFHQTQSFKYTNKHPLSSWYGSCYYTTLGNDYFYPTMTRMMNINVNGNTNAESNQVQAQVQVQIPVLACSTKTNQSNNNRKKLYQYIQKLSQFVHHLFILLFRGTQITLQMSPLLLFTPLSLLESKVSNHSHYIENFTWKYLLQTLHSLGPAFVKLAQWAGTRRDLFSPYICDHLSQFHNQTPPHSWKDTHQTLVQSFGPHYDQQLRIQELLGSGAVAQVYKGYLKGHGLVAVKVLHPNIIHHISRDYQLMYSFASFMDMILPKDLGMSLNLPRAVQTFGLTLNQQVDLQLEAQNLHQFRYHFQNHECIHFPKPMDDWTTSNVLMEEYIDAKPISYYLHSNNHDNNDDNYNNKEMRMKIAQSFVKAFMKMVFIDNFIHCDLHPGNVLVQIQQHNNNNNNNNNHDSPSIIFLDAGISTQLSKHDLQNLKDLFQAVVLNHGERVGRLMVERARYEQCSQIPNGIERFSKGMAELVQEFHNHNYDNNKSANSSSGGGSGLSLGLIQIGSLLKRVLDLCRTYGVEIDPAMSSVVVSVLILEGLGRSLDPDLDLIQCAIPFVMGRVS